ncbi:hypothetical protein BDV12DRAFT_108132 [Aspergillus spectabilis]
MGGFCACPYLGWVGLFCFVFSSGLPWLMGRMVDILVAQAHMFELNEYQTVLHQCQIRIQLCNLYGII